MENMGVCTKERKGVTAAVLDDVYYYIRWRLKLEGETENMGVCTKERKGVTAEALMATPLILFVFSSFSSSQPAE